MDKENAPPVWKASVTVPKEAAGDVAALFELTPPAPQAVLIAEDPFGPEAIVEALYDAPADTELLSRLVGRVVELAPLPDQDWIRLSLEGLPPVRAGRFFVYGAHDAGLIPPGVIPIHIEAGEAFGTETIGYGRRISVVVLPAPPVFLTPKGLDHVGPRAFGYDLDFRSVFDQSA